MAYRAKGIRTLGVIQMIFGVMMGVFGIASLAAVHHWSSYVACGLWIGVWVFLTGLFGYMGARSDTSPNNCLIGLMMGFAITGCVAAAIMLIIYSIAVAQFSERIRCSRSYINCYYYYDHYSLDKSHAESGLALGILLLLLAIAEFFIALASSIYACNACCCATPQHAQPAATQVAYIGPQHGNVVVIPAGGYYPGQTFQTVTTYPGQPAPVYQQQQFQVQGQMYPQQPMQAQMQAPPPAAPHQAFQAQGNVSETEKPPAYNYNQ